MFISFSFLSLSLGGVSTDWREEVVECERGLSQLGLLVSMVFSFVCICGEWSSR